MTVSLPEQRVAHVWRQLRGVIDPEVGLNIVQMGLVYDVHVRDATVQISMTLTTPGCPLGTAIVQGVERVVNELSWVVHTHVELVWDPPWHPGMIREESYRETGR